MASKTLKIGQLFRADDVTGDAAILLKLHEVLVDSFGEKWAIGIDDEGIPYIINESDINREVTETELLLPGKKGKK